MKRRRVILLTAIFGAVFTVDALRTDLWGALTRVAVSVVIGTLLCVVWFWGDEA